MKISLIINCPYCGTQHIDKPEPPCCDQPEEEHGNGAQGHEYRKRWDNPDHHMHLCKIHEGGCGKLFIPEVPKGCEDLDTNGVATLAETTTFG